MAVAKDATDAGARATAVTRGSGCYRGRSVERTTLGRTAATGIATAVLLLAATVASSLATGPAEDQVVVGRWSVVSEAGGAVWSFQPSGLLVLVGPGTLEAEGTWTAGPDLREFDATVDVVASGQVLAVLGQVSPDGSEMAVFVAATEPERPSDADPWPAESRLVGERFGMLPEETPSPSPAPPDCERPQWVEAGVDWDRCDEDPLTAS